MSDDEDYEVYDPDDIADFDYDDVRGQSTAAFADELASVAATALFPCLADDGDEPVTVSQDGKGKSADLTVSFECLSPEALRAEIDRECDAVASILDVNRGLAMVLLLHYRWNREKLVDLYTDAPARVLCAVGEPKPAQDQLPAETGDGRSPPKKRLRRCETSQRSPAPPQPEPDNVCEVCFDDLPEPPNVPATRCGHRFCGDCWRAYLVSKVKDEGQCSVRCMADKCKTALTEDFIAAVADADVYDRWQTLLAQSFVSATTSLRFCPAPSCTETVRCSVSTSALPTIVPTVTCARGHPFCFGCGLQDGHAPAICKIVNQWLDSKDSGTTQWINANTRKCPKCSNNIEKAGGCNRIACRHCSFQFCWVCLKDWSVHGYNQSVCNSFIEPPRTASMDEAQVNLQRWIFYFDRFNNHELSARLDEELVERTQEKMLEIQENSSLSWIETRFMQHAVNELTKCRQSLKWTYAMAHFLSSGNKKQIFEDLQADLEKAVEQLSQLIDDSPIEDASVKNLRRKVMDKTVYVQKRHAVMLVDVAKGLADGYWDWTIPLD
ncbi:hypothetical protein M0805_003636 [Coniferiporia weirii]|nr:hypothetical protein M0805_003636 [Coniferiporia weirii]